MKDKQKCPRSRIKCHEGASFYTVLPLNVNVYYFKIRILLSSPFIFSFPFKTRYLSIFMIMYTFYEASV